MNTQLTYLQPSSYRDPADQRPLSIHLYKLEGGLEACVNKLITPSDCVRPSVRDNPDLQPDEENPLKFYQETKKHSCRGTYWHAHFPVQTDKKAIAPDVDLKSLMIEGSVIDGNIKEEVILHPKIKEVIERVHIPKTGREITAEQYIFQYQNIFCRSEYSRSFPEIPFTEVFTSRSRGNPFCTACSDLSPFEDDIKIDQNEVFMTITKMCGRTTSDNQTHMAHPKVAAQFELIREDIQRLSPTLTQLDLSDALTYEDDTPSGLGFYNLTIFGTTIGSLVIFRPDSDDT